jgi:hypothetical protein
MGLEKSPNCVHTLNVTSSSLLPRLVERSTETSAEFRESFFNLPIASRDLCTSRSFQKQSLTMPPRRPRQILAYENCPELVAMESVSHTRVSR